jgi:kynurenine formamidase
VALWLVNERDVTAIGVDTMSLDPGNSLTFPVHVNFLRTDRYGLENLSNLNAVPPRGALTYVGLIPWEEGSGGPCRVIANW